MTAAHPESIPARREAERRNRPTAAKKFRDAADAVAEHFVSIAVILVDGVRLVLWMFR